MPSLDHPSPSQLDAKCCVITSAGRSAVAVIAVQGAEAAPLVASCFQAATRGPLLAGQVRYGSWVGPQDIDAPHESVVVTPLALDRVEIHCHGGLAASSRIVADLRRCGAVEIGQSDWDDENDQLLIREAKQILQRCVTTRTAAIAMDQARGALLNWAIQSHEKLNQGSCLDDIRREAQSILQFAPLGLHLAEPFQVVLVGPPNVGKSSLLNAMVGYDRSIAFDAAGTTRDVLHAETVIDGWPVRLSDTAGIRDSCEPIEAEGVHRALGAAERADLVLYVSDPETIHDQAANEAWLLSLQGAARIPVVRVLNKSDRLTTADLPSGLDLLTSAISGDGIDTLMANISTKIIRLVPSTAAPVPMTIRQVDCLQQITKAENTQALIGSLETLLSFDPHTQVAKP